MTRTTAKRTRAGAGKARSRSVTAEKSRRQEIDPAAIQTAAQQELDQYLETQSAAIAAETPKQRNARLFSELQQACLIVGAQIVDIIWLCFSAVLYDGDMRLGRISCGFDGIWRAQYRHRIKTASSAYCAVCTLMELSGALPF